MANQGQDPRLRRVESPYSPRTAAPPSAAFVGQHSDKLVEQISRHQLIYSICGLVLGFLCVVGGIVLLLAGVAGKVNWTAKFLGASSGILDAAPGVVLIIVGLFVVFMTRYVLKSRR